MSQNIPPTSQDALDVMARILGGSPQAKDALQAAYALGAVDMAIKIAQPKQEQRKAA